MASSRSRTRDDRASGKSSSALAARSAGLVASLVASLAACNVEASSRGVEATGPLLEPSPKSSDVSIEPFDKVLVEGPLDVEIRVGWPCSVRFTGDEERLSELAAEVREGTLMLYAAVARPWRSGPRAVVRVPELATVTASGSGWIAVSGLDAPRIEVHLRGSGDVLLRGRVGELDVEDVGAGSVDTRALEVGAPADGALGSDANAPR